MNQTITWQFPAPACKWIVFFFSKQNKHKFIGNQLVSASVPNKLDHILFGLLSSTSKVQQGFTVFNQTMFVIV